MTTNARPTARAATDAAGKLRVPPYTLGWQLAMASAEAVRGLADWIERERNDGMTEPFAADFDDAVAEARDMLLAAEACFEASRP